MTELWNLEDNGKTLPRLKDAKPHLVPFLGAGFSQPFCPGWEEFLDNYFKALKQKGDLLAAEIQEFEDIKKPPGERRLERMADFLVEKSREMGFEDELKRQMEVKIPPEKVKKFHLLHEAFPFLKITTNYDSLIETHVPAGVYVKTVYGTQAKQLERLYTHRHETNSLLKIHGGIEDLRSIVLSSRRYEELYGHADRYNEGAKLPAFLKRVFTNSPVLFMGCSLETDRTVMIMADIKDMPRHFALMKLPGNDEEKILLKRRLRDLNMYTIWIEAYDQVEEVLAYLAGGTAEFMLAPAGVFVGREKELESLAAHMESGGVQAITGRLYSIDGAGGVGKTALALEAARRNRSKFKDGILPLFRADEHTPSSFALALARHFKYPLAEPADHEAALRAITAMLQNRHCLLILDNVEKWEDLRYMIPLRTTSSILVTTRNRDIYRKLRNYFTGLKVEEIALEKFSETEVLVLFRGMLAEEYREKEEKIYLDIAKCLGYLPIALRQAISLMAYAPHYRAGELLERLAGEERLDMLRRGCAEAESDSRVIETVFDLAAPQLTYELKEVLEMLAVCSPGPVYPDFLRRLDRSGSLGIDEALERLYTYSWLDRREIAGERVYELHRLVRDLVRGQGPLRYLEDFIRVVHEMFTDKGVHFRVKERYYFQLEEAFDAAVQEKDPRLKDWLYHIYKFCTYRGYGHFYLELTEAVERLFPGDQRETKDMYCFRANILKHFGKYKESMIFYRKYEEMCEELGDRPGLAWCYGKKALILRRKGQLEEAMSLHKKEEALCEELGDRAGLAGCYGNQALILADWGQLEEAMSLHKKMEALCEELGDRDGLATCYGNQALILSDWGQLDAAMILHKKKETHCERLGDRAGLAGCYCNQALIHQRKGQLEEAMILYKKEENIQKELGNPGGLAMCYGNQALILKTLGQLEEAISLQKKEETLCEELGDRAGLARTYVNQAAILQVKGNMEETMTLLKKGETLYEELGNRAGLAVCYGNQATIHYLKGELDLAMKLQKKNEKIKEELDDRAGLATCYGNQALILSHWGQLEEAMILHKKEENICEELGDRAGLARTWWNQGLIHEQQGDSHSQVHLWQKSIETDKSMGIPTDNNEKALTELMKKIKENV